MTDRSRRGAAALAAAVALALVAGCGDDDDSGEQGVTTLPRPGGVEHVEAPPTDLPPVDALDLLPSYGQVFADHRLELTARGGLIDLDGYRSSPTGTHLALYAAPTGDRSPEDYLDAVVSLTAELAPDLFERYPGLESFDICQEQAPPPGGWGDRAPGTVTQIDLTRDQVESLDWPTATLVDVLVAIRTLPEGVARVQSAVAELDGWQQAVAEVDARTGTPD